MSDPSTTDPAPKDPAPKHVQRFAVYDTTLLRFVGPVHDTKKAADAYAKTLPKGREYEAREVS